MTSYSLTLRIKPILLDEILRIFGPKARKIYFKNNPVSNSVGLFVQNIQRIVMPLKYMHCAY